MREEKPYIQLDLPKRHLSEGRQNYKPLPTYGDKARSGLLVLEQQAKGLSVASLILTRLEYTPLDDGGFSTRILGLAGLNSSWYMFTRGTQVMRRKLNLPKLVDDENEFYETKQGLLKMSKNGLVDATIQAEKFAQSYKQRREGERAREVLGRNLGNTSLSLACLGVVDTTVNMGAFDAQELARETCLEALENAREVAISIGAYPSMAQIGNEQSETMLYWRRRAPKEAVQLVDGAIGDSLNVKSFFNER